MSAKILIVEDELVIAQYIKETLEELCYCVLGVAVSGKKAMEMAKANSPDLILMDIRIKGDLDGIDTAIEILKHTNCAIVYLTSYSDSETLSKAKKTYPWGYIVKPFEKINLRTTIEIALYNHKNKKSNTPLVQELKNTQSKITDLISNIQPYKDNDIIHTMKEAARYLGISPKTVQRSIEKGEFPTPILKIDLGSHKQRGWKKEDLDSFRPQIRKRGRPASTS